VGYSTFINKSLFLNIPFEAIDWSAVEKTEHKGETGSSWWQTKKFGGLRLRIVEYSPGYLADHWCYKGHIVQCLEGSFTSELKDGRTITLSQGDTYIVSDDMSAHRSISEHGVKLLIIDGDFLEWGSNGIVPDHLETDRLSLDIIRIPDSSFLQQLVNTKGWLRFIGDRNVHSDADAVRYIQRMMEPHATVHVVRLRASGQPIGITTLIKRPHLDFPDIGFALLPEFEGKGFSFEASHCLMQYIEQKGELASILAITLKDNPRSISLLERLGLSYERTINQEGEKLMLFSKKF
jgi:RimJ/RimL family protein N-acetyltransferase